jgi:uncharacterized protein YwbE
VFGVVHHRRRRRGHGRGRFKHKRLKAPPGLRVGVVQKVRDKTGNLLKIKTRALFGRLKDIRRLIRKLKLGDGINTAHIERCNGTMRGGVARLGRKTRNLSRESMPLRWSVAVWRDVYNWIRPHLALDGVTPAVASGLTKQIWTMQQYVDYPVHVDDLQHPIWDQEQKNR